MAKARAVLSKALFFAVLLVLLLGHCRGQNEEDATEGGDSITTETTELAEEDQEKESTTEAEETENENDGPENETEEQEIETEESDNNDQDSENEENVSEVEPTEEQIDLQATQSSVTSNPITEKRSTPMGVIVDAQGKKTRRPCKCIQKKKHKVLKEITYIPLQPIKQKEGKFKGFTCNCAHLRKLPRRTTISTRNSISTRRVKESWG